MSHSSSPFDRIRETYRRGGVSSVFSLITGYLAWKLKGSPQEPLEPIESRLDRVESTAVVLLMREWYATAKPRSSPMVSIILPTRDRPVELERAISSAMAQSYENWELLIVNDGTGTLDLGMVGKDPRVSVVESSGSGVGAARNRGLDRASGEIVTFLDDDNVMDPHWIKSVVLAMENDPDTEVLIGAQIVSPDPGHPEHHRVRFPSRFDWVALTEANYVDMGQLAHRAQNAIRFDESLPAFVDWDYVVRLTVDKTPRLVPAVSGIYLTGSSSRLSYQDRQTLHKKIRSRFASLRQRESDHTFKSIGHHDARAITNLARRFQEDKNLPLRALLAGDSVRIAAARKALDRVENLVWTDEAGDPNDAFDLVVIDGFDLDPSDSLGDRGLIIGLGAHEHDYAIRIETVAQRRVGDQLWVGARYEIKLEQLFDGATLVKLGLDLKDGD